MKAAVLAVNYALIVISLPFELVKLIGLLVIYLGAGIYAIGEWVIEDVLTRFIRNKLVYWPIKNNVCLYCEHCKYLYKVYPYENQYTCDLPMPDGKHMGNIRNPLIFRACGQFDPEEGVENHGRQA
jgi:hypothetical protein